MLQIKNLSIKVKSKDREIDILKDINLELEENKIYVITGPNGGGKSSLAKVIMGIYRPDSGRIILDGQDITELDVTQRAKLGIGYAFQYPPRFKGIKVKELLDIASTKGKKGNMCDLLFDVGLCAQDYLNREMDASLSGGEAKRIEIATILARNLKIALFDEPEAGIDLWSFNRLAETFKNMHSRFDTTIVIISHQERILNLADEVVLMSKGSIVEKTTKEKILSEVYRNDNCKCSTNCEKGARYNVEFVG
jgi:Fe-S cluster assembly ATP-binding protein